MGATCSEHKIELIDNIHTFFRRTGMLSYYKELEYLGFFLDNVTGIFSGPQAGLLIDFCDKNPAYHIITQTHPGRYENRYVSGKRTYFLADGEKNPNLVLNPFIKQNAELFAQDMLDKALAMIADIDRCNKRK